MMGATAIGGKRADAKGLPDVLIMGALSVDQPVLFDELPDAPPPPDDGRRYRWVFDVRFVLLVGALVVVTMLPLMTRVSAEREPGSSGGVMDFNLRIEVRFPEVPLVVDLRKDGDEEQIVVGDEGK